MDVVNKRTIVRVCKSRGWTIQPDALIKIEDHCRARGTFEHTMDAISKTMIGQQKKTITIQVLKTVLNSVESSENLVHSNEKRNPRNNANSQEGSGKFDFQPAFSDLKTWSSFEAPRLFYDVTRRQLHVDEECVSLFGTADDKVSCSLNDALVPSVFDNSSASKAILFCA
jgi:hypothetical protein